MRYTINRITDGEDELILNYQELNAEVEEALFFMEKRIKKLMGKKIRFVLDMGNGMGRR